MATASPTLTVFTPTYNRAHTLSRVHDSLKQQTFRDFEWLIVDDGSSDDTRQIVEEWAKVAEFPVRYVWQQNKGKHEATLAAIAEAKGELFLTFDSDDGCLPHAFERLLYHWNQIPADQKDRFSAVTGLCQDQFGTLVGTRFPVDVLDSNSAELYYRYKVRGEKWGFQKTSVLREHIPREENRNELVATSIIWNEIGRTYQTRYVNEIFRIYWIEGQSLCHFQPGRKIAPGGRMHNLMTLNRDLDYFRDAPVEFLRSAVHFSRFSFHLGHGLATQWGHLEHPLAKLLWLVALPVGFLVYFRERKG